MEGMVRRRVLWIAGGVVALVVIAGAAVLYFFRDTATPLTEEEVVANVTVTGGGEPGDDGVYVYATSGFQEVDALSGARHDYPEETFLTLQTEGCGTKVRWEALQERWEEELVCEDGRIDGMNAFHEWFGISELRQYVCGDDARAYPRGGETSWSFTCSSDVTRWEYLYEVVGTETLDIAGEEVATLHLRITGTVAGESVGDAEINNWILPGTDLIVKRTARVDNITDSIFGDVTFHEEFEIVLQSLTPIGEPS